MRHLVYGIVNADDLGISPQVNAAIFEMMGKGRVSSASIIANGPALDDALTGLRDFPHCSFGVHLNLTEFTPLRPSPALAPLLGSDGRFTPQISSMHIDARLHAAIARELSAQVELLRSRGVRLSHFDSHQHVHTRPALFPVLKLLQRRYGVRRVRITRNLFRSNHPVTRTHHAKKALWNFALRHCFATTTTDLMGDLLSFLDQVGEIRQDSTVEIMVHPGDKSRAAENERLLTEWWAGIPARFKQINFHDLRH